MTYEEEAILKLKLKPKDEMCFYCLKKFNLNDNYKILNSKTILHDNCYIVYKIKTYILNRFIIWLCVLIILVTCVGVYEFSK